MLIRKNSILNQLPNDKLSERERIFIEAIVHSINIIDVSYHRLAKLLIDDSDNLATELPMIEVWNIIDSCHRLRCIIEKTPGIKKRESWFQITVRKLKGTEDIRHFIQHYDREIDNLIDQVKPLLGHLTWFHNLNENEFKVGLIVPGAIRKFKGLEVVNPAGKLVRGKIDLITFHIGNQKISLSDIFHNLTDFITGLENHILQK